ncbi:hypothetical protein BGZ94_008773 [Podila epigama]|nr:hypothetical protein BGZ94_008773 [Podila epigama]
MEDLAIVYAVIAGKDHRDAVSQTQPNVALPAPIAPGAKGQLKGLRIGVHRQWFEDVLHKESADVCYEMLEKLCKEQGAVLVDIRATELLENSKAHTITISGEMLAKLDKDRYKLNHQSRLELAVINSLKVSDYFRAQQQRTRSIRFLESTFGHKDNDIEHLMKYPSMASWKEYVDVIATPTTANLPPKVHSNAEAYGESNFLNNVKTMQYMTMANFTGIPGVTVVAGYTKKEYVHLNGETYSTGLPIGLQFMSEWWDEKSLIKIGMLCEQALGNQREQPKVWYGDYSLEDASSQ